VACRFTELVIDCHDHDLLGRFWSAYTQGRMPIIKWLSNC
jgi:hypothetical protein